MSSLRWHFDLVCFDVGTILNNKAAAVRTMQLADYIYIVFEPTNPVLKLMDQLKKENILGKLGIDLTRVNFVLNHRSSHLTPVKQKDVEREFGFPVVADIPVDKVVTESENNGKGLTPILESPDSSFAAAVTTICRQVAGDFIPEVERDTSILKKFLKWRKSS